MSHKQARLITAIKDAMEAQGVKACDIARASGSSAGTISYAMSGKAQMRDERWRMICEYLHLDFDEIVADAPPCDDQKEEKTMEAVAVKQPESRIDHAGELKQARQQMEKLSMDCMVLAAYAAKHLEEDIRHGMEIGVQELRILLNTVGTYIDPA